MSKYPDRVGIFDLTAERDNLVSNKKFNNNTEIANYLGISKVTVGKYLNKDLIYKDMYKFKPISL
jgi:DNA invertase Pin-like site-specific DNA recombinase